MGGTIGFGKRFCFCFKIRKQLTHIFCPPSFLFFLPRMWVQSMKEEQLSCNNEEEYHKLGTDGWEDSESQMPQSHNSYPQSAFLSTTHHLKGKKNNLFQFSSVQFSHSVVSHSLRPHELQHARPTCPSPTPRVQSNSHPSIR